MARKEPLAKANWKTPVYTIGGLVAAVITGALANKLAGVEWKGIGPLLKHFPRQFWAFIAWPIPIPLTLLLLLLALVWWFWRQTLRLGAEISTKFARERDFAALQNQATSALQK